MWSKEGGVYIYPHLSGEPGIAQREWLGWLYPTLMALPYTGFFSVLPDVIA